MGENSSHKTNGIIMQELNFIIPYNQAKYNIKDIKISKDHISFMMNKKFYQWDKTLLVDTIERNDEYFACINGLDYSIKKDSSLSLISSKLSKNDAAIKKGSKVTSPMPGKIFKLLFKEGDKVKKGDVMIILEAMKMEHPIKANSDSLISKIHVKVGDLVSIQKLLVEFQE